MTKQQLKRHKQGLRLNTPPPRVMPMRVRPNRAQLREELRQEILDELWEDMLNA